MIALAKKVGMQEEARIRKVLYYNNIYYDSPKIVIGEVLFFGYI